MLDVTSPASLENEISKLCEGCGQPFAPRAHTGGKPQRYCSPDCRQSFHGKAQRSQHSPTCSALVPAGPIIDHPKPENEPAATPEDFDWNDAGDLILRQQGAIACYFNPAGEFVIRQRGWPAEDQFIFVSPDAAGDFIDRLTDAFGVPSIGK